MKFLTKSRILGAALASLVVVSTAAFALTNPPSFPPRQLQNQELTYFRKTVNFNDANISAGVKFGALPPGAFITGIKCYVTTAFNAGTTNSLLIGTTQGGSQILAGGTTAGTNCVAATTGIQSITAAAGLGLAVTALSNTPTGSTGGWDLWVTYTQTGTAGTAGAVTFIIDYAVNNDQ